MGLFKNSTFQNPVFFKESNRAILELNMLKSILEKTHDTSLERKAKLISFGIEGEKNIHFELQNSHMPMYVLHDIYLEDDGLSAQIDYIIMTKKKIFIIECKNLIGTITIDHNGNFTREYMINNHRIKEGVYSPITQNKRHLDLIKQLREKDMGYIQKKLFDKYFYNDYLSLIVLANPKSILNSRYAHKEIKDKVIKADQLIRYIQETTKNDNNVYSEEDLKNLSQWFMKHHIEREIEIPNDIIQETHCQKEQQIVDNNNDLINELKKYRLNLSRKNNIKPYVIFTNQQLDSLIEMLPTTIDELKKISGFGEVKCERYGHEIIEIIKKYKS